MVLHISADKQAYAHANKLFLEAVAGIYEEGDIVLVHDYDLMLLPALLRKRFPDITCGFFLHCPFPSTGEPSVAARFRPLDITQQLVNACEEEILP